MLTIIPTNVKALVGALMHNKALVGALSVIVKTSPMVRLQLYPGRLQHLLPDAAAGADPRHLLLPRLQAPLLPRVPAVPGPGGRHRRVRRGGARARQQVGTKRIKTPTKKDVSNP